MSGCIYFGGYVVTVLISYFMLRDAYQNEEYANSTDSAIDFDVIFMFVPVYNIFLGLTALNDSRKKDKEKKPLHKLFFRIK